MTPSQPKTFKTLKAEWYAKLKKSGFKDIESDQAVGHPVLKTTPINNIANRYDQSRFDARQDYYRLAGFFLHDHEFENKKEKFIWELHCEGKSVREIANILKNKGYSAYKKSSTHNTIVDLEKKMYFKNKI